MDLLKKAWKTSCDDLELTEDDLYACLYAFQSTETLINIAVRFLSSFTDLPKPHSQIAQLSQSNDITSTSSNIKNAAGRINTTLLSDVGR